MELICLKKHWRVWSTFKHLKRLCTAEAPYDRELSSSAFRWTPWSTPCTRRTVVHLKYPFYTWRTARFLEGPRGSPKNILFLRVYIGNNGGRHSRWANLTFWVTILVIHLAVLIWTKISRTIGQIVLMTFPICGMIKWYASERWTQWDRRHICGSEKYESKWLTIRSANMFT